MTYGIIFRLAFIATMILLVALLALIVALVKRLAAWVKSIKLKKPTCVSEEGLLHGVTGKS